jgi:hypothetical protein
VGVWGRCYIEIYIFLDSTTQFTVFGVPNP